jgi:hypothetical protein
LLVCCLIACLKWWWLLKCKNAHSRTGQYLF